MTCASQTENRISYNGYAPFSKKIYSKLTLIILSTWKHNSTFFKIRHWATDRNVSYKIVVGGCTIVQQDNDIVCVTALDTYEGLTQKLLEGIDFIYTHDFSWTHIMKIDDTDIDKYPKYGNFKLLEYELGMTPYPYFGRRVYFFNDAHHKNSSYRYYHLPRVDTSSIWYTKKYEGSFVSTAAGGEGYVLKRTLIRNISKKIHVSFYGPYEDIAVANYAKKHGFKPRPFTLFQCNKSVS